MGGGGGGGGGVHERALLPTTLQRYYPNITIIFEMDELHVRRSVTFYIIFCL
jgi:hypothetical protein